MTSISAVPAIDILGFEAGHEEAFPQFEQILGHIANPHTFNFPVQYKRVAGIYYSTLVTNPTPKTCELMVTASQQLEQGGCKAIVSCCGFTSLFQKELAASVEIPVFTSSLLLIPLITQIITPDQAVGVITFNKNNFTDAHLRASGVTDKMTVWSKGLEGQPEWSRILCNPDADFSPACFGNEVVQVAKALVSDHPDIGAIVLECGDLPPFATIIREALNLPVFDLVTMVNMAHEVVALDRWQATTTALRTKTYAE